jgi:hypothetical protein
MRIHTKKKIKEKSDMYEETYVKSDGHGGEKTIGEYRDPAMEPDVKFVSEFSSDGKFLGMRKVKRSLYD